MTVSAEQVDRYIEVLGKTRNKRIASDVAGFSKSWPLKQQKRDAVFRRRSLEAIADLDAEVSRRLVDVVLNGAPTVTLDADGEVQSVQRRYCPKTTLTYAERFLGWGPDAQDDEQTTKQVVLMGSDGKPVPLLAQLAAGVAKDKGITIVPPGQADAEPDPDPAGEEYW